MRKLALLTEYLSGSNADRVELSLAAIEKIVGSVLPTSAQSHRAFWSNSSANGYSYAWLDAGYRTSLAGTWPTAVVFLRQGTRPVARPVPRGRGRERSAKLGSPASEPETTAILVGCVGRKAAKPAQAKDLYISELFLRRRRYAEKSGRPWLILSAKHGVLDPDTTIQPYNVTLTAMRHAERLEWGRRVFDQLHNRFGPLERKAFEIHAGAEYVTPLRRLLAQAGALLRAPLAGLRIGEQLRWYGASRPSPQPVPDPPGGSFLPIAQGLGKEITAAFVTGSLDFSARSGTPTQGWEGMPEVAAATALKKFGATPADVRLFITFCAAMDRARDADRLWAQGVELFRASPWCYQPGIVVERRLHQLADALRSHGVSQRHSVDSAAWCVIAESLADPAAVPAIKRAIFNGVGSAAELLQALQATTAAGNPRSPMLAGPKVGPMWVRMLAVPGGAEIAGIGELPVAVDVQVRKVTEYLGVTKTHGRPLDEVRELIQAAWRADVAVGGAEGPEPLQGTCAALDPALWYFAKWGCTFCERAGRRVPVHAICQSCLFGRRSQPSQAPSP